MPVRVVTVYVPSFTSAQLNAQEETGRQTPRQPQRVETVDAGATIYSYWRFMRITAGLVSLNEAGNRLICYPMIA